jgi:hypothetical protein
VGKDAAPVLAAALARAAVGEWMDGTRDGMARGATAINVR